MASKNIWDSVFDLIACTILLITASIVIFSLGLMAYRDVLGNTSKAQTVQDDAYHINKCDFDKP